jgi:hypothetical protein
MRCIVYDNSQGAATSAELQACARGDLFLPSASQCVRQRVVCGMEYICMCLAGASVSARRREAMPMPTRPSRRRGQTRLEFKRAPNPDPEHAYIALSSRASRGETERVRKELEVVYATLTTMRTGMGQRKLKRESKFRPEDAMPLPHLVVVVSLRALYVLRLRCTARNAHCGIRPCLQHLASTTRSIKPLTH